MQFKTFIGPRLTESKRNPGAVRRIVSDGATDGKSGSAADYYWRKIRLSDPASKTDSHRVNNPTNEINYQGK
jgi:hypothetical protein